MSGGVPSGIKEKVTAVVLSKISNIELDCIDVPGDGSCFFHAVLRAYHYSYVETKSKDLRKRYVKEVRHQLASHLESKTSTGEPWYYQALGGALAEIGKVDKTYSLPYLLKELRGSGSVGDAYIDLLADYLNLDIYIGDSGTGDVYRRGNNPSGKRDSIFLLYRRSEGVGHFNCLGITRPNSPTIDTIFSSGHPLTQKFRLRYF